MTAERKVEVFSAGRPVCGEAVALARRAAGPLIQPGCRGWAFRLRARVRPGRPNFSLFEAR
jgi:hypothetical protein